MSASEAPLLDQLIQALRCLPGVGPKSAQRMAFHLLERERAGGKRLAEALTAAIDRVGHCERCRNFSERSLCTLCASERRDRSQLCVVESPADVSAIEQSADYRGLYFVLMGRMSPLDGIRPEDIGIDRLAARLDEGDVREVILATGTTVEGEATAHYIGHMAQRRGIRATRIAHGVPLGGELGFVDGGTLTCHDCEAGNLNSKIKTARVSSFGRRAAMLPVLFLACASALAQDTEEGSCDDPVHRSAACGTFSILFENDLFTGTDRYYTNGIKLSWMSRDLRQFSQWEHTPASLRGFFEAFDQFQPGREKNVGVFIGQKLYTPNDIQQRALIVNDRPYSGWLFGGLSLNSKNSVALDTIELQLGMVGPAALGEETQNFVHEVRGFPTAKGWDNQLKNELAFSLYYERKQRLWDYFNPDSLLGADFIAHAGAAGGTVHTYANGGAELRFGYNIPADFGTSLIRPGGDVSAPVLTADAPHHDPRRFGTYIFGAVTGRAVLRDIFLDGNTFTDSHSVDKENFVGDFIWGAGVTWRGLKLTYSQIYRTKEFKNQDTASQYGSINLSVIF